MCLWSCFCDCVYATRCVWFKLYIPSLLLDLALTIFIIVQLFNLSVFACCTDNRGSFNSKCAYNHIGGADDVGVATNGFCYRKDDDFSCGGNLTSCAIAQNITISDVCSQSVLQQVANVSTDAFIAILIIKAIGVLFSLFLEIRSVCCEKKPPGSAEAEESKSCCQECSSKCCSSITTIVLRIFFFWCLEQL